MLQADDLVIDFYTVLDDALKARGMYYNAFTVTNADIEIPMVTISKCRDLHLLSFLIFV